MSGPLRLVVAPIAVALLVLAVVLGVMRLVDPPGEGSAGSDGGSDVGTGAGSDVGAGAGSGVPGSPGTAQPAPSGSSSDQPDPDAPMSRFTSVARGADDRSLAVSFWGGVADCYSYTVRAEEGDGVVTLRLRERRTFEGPCIELALQYDRTVQLGRPLGTRRVVDAQSGETLLGPTR